MTCKSLAVLVVLAVLACALAAADEKYTDKYDNIDIKEVILNDRLMEAYLKCLLGQGKCTPEILEVKNNMQDALETGCAKCTERQRSGVKDMIKHLIEQRPSYWKSVTDKYDPQGIWKKKYEDEAKKEGIQLP